MKRRDVVGCTAGSWRVPDDPGELRVALLGAGKMARFHLQALTSMEGVRVTAICNRSSNAGELMAREFGIASVYRDVEALLRQGDLDAAVVAVSHGATCDVAAQVLSAGIPCLIEKPAGFSSNQTAHLAELASSGSCVNLVGLNRRFYSTIQQARLAVGHHGPISGVAIEAHEPIVDYRARGQFPGWVYDEWMMANSIHAIDLFRMLCGEAAAVHAFTAARSEPNGDRFAASIQFERGALGSFTAHWDSPRGFTLKIYGDGVTAEFSSPEQGFLRYHDGRRIALAPDWADTRFKMGLYWQDAAFLQAVCDGLPLPFPASDLADNVRTMRLVEQISGRRSVH